MGRDRENLERFLTRLTDTVPDTGACRCASARAGAIISDVSAADSDDPARLFPLVRHRTENGKA
jgi:hypothetical protein